MTCSEFGARYTMVNKRSYACASYANGRACTNDLHVRRNLVEDRILAGVRESLGRNDVLDEIERRVALALAVARKAKVDPKRAADLQSQLENLVTAIATGGMRSSAALGHRLAEVEAELKQLQRIRPAVTPPVHDVRRRIKAAVARLPTVLEEDRSAAGPPCGMLAWARR